MNIVIFEDDAHGDFYPLSLTRPVWELKGGCFSLRERWERFFPAALPGEKLELQYLTRDKLAPLFRERYPDLRINQLDCAIDDALLVNGALIPDKRILRLGKNEILMSGSRPLAARCALKPGGGRVEDVLAMLRDDPSLARAEGAGLEALGHLWDLVDMNGELIRRDYPLMCGDSPDAERGDVTIVGDRTQVYIEKGARIDPFVCIDTTKGPVVIGRNSLIHSFTRIEGPCYIGSDCVILGAKIREGCHIGDSCRIGGEIEASIVQGFSNKYHDGFIGHAYIGEWVNLGALTTNSDLKNDYSKVKVSFPGRRAATGRIKAGCYIGDFTRTSIGALIPTGGAIGACCMIVHAGGMTPHHVPSFAWFADNCLQEGGNLDAVLRSCDAAMGRRGMSLTDRHRALLEELHDTSAENRKAETERWKDLRR